MNTNTNITPPFWPVANVSPFYEPQGPCAQNSNRPNGYQHTGIDIPAPLGTAVMATNAGAVRVIRNNDNAGNSVFLDIGDRYTVAFFHLDSILVNENDYISSGTLIGTVGQSGGSLSPHLHISINTHKLLETNDVDVLWWLQTGSIRKPD